MKFARFKSQTNLGSRTLDCVDLVRKLCPFTVSNATRCKPQVKYIHCSSPALVCFCFCVPETKTDWVGQIVDPPLGGLWGTCPLPISPAAHQPHQQPVFTSFSTQSLLDCLPLLMVIRVLYSAPSVLRTLGSKILVFQCVQRAVYLPKSFTCFQRAGPFLLEHSSQLPPQSKP